MQKKILSYMMFISFCGIILCTAVFYAIQTIIAQNSADEISLLRISDVESRIENNNLQLEQLIEIVKEENLASARTVAMLIETDPDIVGDSEKLEEIAKAINVDEISIVDANGILRWGTQPYKYNMDLAGSTQTESLLYPLRDSSVEVAQEPMIAATSGVMRQYASVSLRHTKGAVVIGVIPFRLLAQSEEMNIANILRNVNIGETGYMFSVSNKTELITSHPNPGLIGSWLRIDPENKVGYMDINGQRVRYNVSVLEDETLVSVVPTDEMFAQRSLSTVFFLIFTIILFIIYCVMLNLYLRKKVIGGIYNILGTLDEISGGNLNAVANVRTNTEFNRLSDGINEMLSGIKSKIAEVSEAVIVAEEASNAKSSFLANMSHEIRTPMNSIIGMTDLLLYEKLSSHQLHYVKDIKISAESLLGIINDILDLSKISEGKLQVTPTDINLGILLKNIVSMMSFNANCKDLRFIDDVQINENEYIYIDDVRLKQVIVNLLANAIKFTKTGHVKLTARVENGEVKFEISDTGIGIKSEDIPVIFNVFEQVDKRKNRTIKGTGLGLSITKSLVELMNGKIWVESEYGVGTTFHVTIPYIKGDESAVNVVSDETLQIFAPEAAILVVDDIQTNLTVAAGLLRLCGIKADTATSGKEAVELVKARNYDIVFMDHMMPEMDGIETMWRIRDLGEKYGSFPIIALTANAMKESKDLLLASGMSDFLSKPIDINALVLLLQKWLPSEKVSIRENVQTDSSSREYTAALDAVSRISGIDLDSALTRLGGLQDVLETSIKQFAFAANKKIDTMKTNINSGDLQSFGMEAHGLKGALANIGAMRCSELAAELEAAAKREDKLFCVEKFPMFFNVIETLATDLKSVFNATEKTESSLQGDDGLLSLKVKEAIECLDNFEANDALAHLKELDGYTFGEERNALLRDAQNAVQAFSYDTASALLKNILNN